MLRFLGIGAQKAGTTWLYEVLRQHPQVGFPLGKESHYWSLVVKHPDADAAQRYLANFSDPARLEGEITPAYATLGDAAIRELRAAAPELRLILMLRNPLERAWSSAQMVMSKLGMSESEATDDWLLTLLRSRASLQRGDYADIIRRWLRWFPKQALLTRHFEELRTDPEGLANDCFRHIGLDPLSSAQLRQMGTRRVVFAGPQRPLRPQLWRELQSIYQPRISALEQVLGQDLQAWLSPPRSQTPQPGSQASGTAKSAQAAYRRRGPDPGPVINFIIAGPPGTGERGLVRALGRHPQLSVAAPSFDPGLTSHGLGPNVAEALRLVAPEPSVDNGRVTPCRGLVQTQLATLGADGRHRLRKQWPSLRVLLGRRDPIGRRLAAAAEALRSAQLEPDEVTPGWLQAWLASRAQRLQEDMDAAYRGWCATLGTEAVLQLDHAALEQDPDAVLRRCCAFLGVCPIEARGNVLTDHREQGAIAHSLPPGSRARALLESWPNQESGDAA